MQAVKKDSSIHVRLTITDKMKLQELADKMGLTVSGLICYIANNPQLLERK